MRHSVLLAVVLLAACGPAAAPPSSAPGATPPGTVASPPATPGTVTAPSPPTASPAPLPALPRIVGSYDLQALPEASGIVAAAVVPGGWWLVSDGPGTDRVVAVDADGTTLGEVVLDGFVGEDVEDLAAGPCGPGDVRRCVYVGDIGDNRAVREDIAVLRFPEPDPTATAAVTPEVARFTYPDGPRDVEAMLVDAEGRVLLISKADRAARLYVAETFADGELADHGPVPVPDPASPLHSTQTGVVVTAADSQPGVVLLRTYDSVVAYTAEEPGAPLVTFAGWPAAEVPGPLERQGEAIALTADGTAFATVSEGVAALRLTPLG